MRERNLTNTYGGPTLDLGIHPIPAGYVTFAGIQPTAKVWGREGLITDVVLQSLTPPDPVRLTMALSTGLLRTAGVDTWTGNLIALPASVWRMERNGRPQVLDALAGQTVVPKPHANPCRPIIAKSDLARMLGATVIPAEPNERPPEWEATLLLDSSPPLIVGADKSVADRPEDKTDADTVLLDGWAKGYAHAWLDHYKTTPVTTSVLVQAGKEWSYTEREVRAAYKRLPAKYRNPSRT